MTKLIKVICLVLSSCIFLPSAFSQMAVHDAPAQVQRAVDHAEQLAKWTESINKATEQVARINEMIDQLSDVKGLIGTGMESIGMDPSIVSTVDLAKAVNRFGESLQELQQQQVSVDLEALRQATTDPHAWERYLTTSKSYERTQKAQGDYDEQMKKLDAERRKAEARLAAARSLGETMKTEAVIQLIDTATDRLDAERRRAFEQQQANYIENQNQKDAWDQAARDWTAKEYETFGKSIDNLLKAKPGNPRTK